jgi:hypothetical protein
VFVRQAGEHRTRIVDIGRLPRISSPSNTIVSAARSTAAFLALSSAATRRSLACTIRSRYAAGGSSFSRRSSTSAAMTTSGMPSASSSARRRGDAEPSPRGERALITGAE